MLNLVARWGNCFNVTLRPFYSLEKVPVPLCRRLCGRIGGVDGCGEEKNLFSTTEFQPATFRLFAEPTTVSRALSREQNDIRGMLFGTLLLATCCFELLKVCSYMVLNMKRGNGKFGRIEN